MKRFSILVIILLGLVLVKISFARSVDPKNDKTASSQTIVPVQNNVVTKQPPEVFSLSNAQFVSQSFNNCGPASLSMLMGMLGKQVSQEELAEKMRPFNNPFGGVDDKSVFPEEIVATAKEYGFSALHRPNGNLDTLKTLIASGFPVLVRTYLNPQEDIGHYRIVRGYDSVNQTFTQDDSYQGSNIVYSFAEFENMWEPFNHEYVVVYPTDKQEVVAAILKKDIDEKTAWKNALESVNNTLKQSPDDTNALFNRSIALYHLGNYQESVADFETIKDKLPSRTLWYQLEPFEAYLQTKHYDKLFALSDEILNNGDLAFSELYQLRGEAYQQQGKTEEAKDEFAKAYQYNIHFDEVKKALGL